MPRSDINLAPVSLHRENVRYLDEGDTVIAGYFGSGAALLGNMLLELGLAYVDLYTERLTGSDRSQVATGWGEYRRRLKAIGGADQASGGSRALPTAGRLVKTHLPTSEFAGTGVRSAILLVRDPRDAVHSYYHWRVGFGEEPETRSFDEFLRHGPPGVGPPARAWAAFYDDWLSYGRSSLESCAVVRFESLKTDPEGALALVLEALRLDADPAALREASRRSSFEAMRAHEDAVAAGADDGHRIMRRGVVGEWVEWWTPEHAEAFGGPEVRRTAQRLGYALDAAPAHRVQ